MKCSVCKQELKKGFLTADGIKIWKCRCGNWKQSNVDSKIIYEDADSPKPTLRFLYD